jgi:hypothetical protein
MRTANLKHGNLGDVEVLLGGKVIEAWDAKYDQPYLLDALSELEDKIKDRDVTSLRFGYVVMPITKDYPDFNRALVDLLEEQGMDVRIVSFNDWIAEQFMRGAAAGVPQDRLSAAWLQAYAESLALARPGRAPIDEPTFEWLQTLLQVLA